MVIKNIVSLSLNVPIQTKLDLKDDPRVITAVNVKRGINNAQAQLTTQCWRWAILDFKDRIFFSCLPLQDDKSSASFLKGYLFYLNLKQ